MDRIIGIVGGLGPYAGIDLNKKIFDQTISSRDQDHLNVLLASFPGQISDRTEYIYDKTIENPAFQIYNVIKILNDQGADVIGIPCNTAHCTHIFDVIQKMILNNNMEINLINMIEETALFMQNHYGSVKTAGILATNGTVYTNIYTDVFSKYRISVLNPDDEIQNNCVHRAIYDNLFGIKSISDPVDKRAIHLLNKSVDHLIENSADAIILGCTEIPMALAKMNKASVPFVDPTLILARALVKQVAPEKLKPL